MTLRPYQAEFVANLQAALDRHHRVLGVMPTGGGKTVCFTEIVRSAAQANQTIFALAHRTNIVEQIGASLERAGVPHGWIMPGRDPEDQPVMVGMVQSATRRLPKLPVPDLIVFDEAHHVSAKSYMKIIDAYPDAWVLGVTATPMGAGGKGLGGVFRYLTLGPRMRWLIDRGYLADYVYYEPPVVAKINNLRIRAGDVAQEEAEEAMNQNFVTGDAIKHYAKYLQGAPAIAFCHSVQHAEHVAAQFCAAGWKSASVHGKMAQTEQAKRIAGIGNGELNVLTSCELISEGTDIPAVQGAILLRITYEWNVYSQQIGRVLRPKPDGSKAIILDHVGNRLRLALPDYEHKWSLEDTVKKPRPPPVRQCPACYAAFPPVRNCPACGYEFWRDPKPMRMPVQIEAELQEVSSAQISEDKVALRGAIYGCRTLKHVQEVAKKFGKTSRWAYVQWNILCRYRSGSVLNDIPVAP